jgi:small subunit ribosomal protein S20
MIAAVFFAGRELLLPTRSAAKAWRKSEERRQRNRSSRSAAKTRVRTAAEAIVAAPKESEEAVRVAISSLDRAAQRGAVHPNTAARRKARLMHKYNTALAAEAAAAAAAATAKAEAKPARGAKAKEKKEEKKAPAKAERGKKPKK